MIRDLSESLQTLLEDPVHAGDFPELAAAQVSFERPADSFQPAQTTLDLFLYTIRENTTLRNNEPTVSYVGRSATITPPPVRIDCSYLVTAFPVGGVNATLQEHRLLSQALQLFSRYPQLPPQYLQGTLIGQEPPLPVLTAQADGVANLSEFWSALGARIRAGFIVVATVAMPALLPADHPLVTRKTLAVGQDAPDREPFVQIAGRVLEAGGSGIEGATVDLTDIGLSTRSTTLGRFMFPQVPAGTHTLRVTATGYSPATRQVAVPGRSEDFELVVTAI